MNDFTEMLTDSAARLFGDLCTRTSHDAAEAGQWLPDLWSSIDAVGLTSLDASCDDASTELEIMASIAKTAGAFNVPLPVIENLIARRVLRDSGLTADEGPATIAISLPSNRLKLQQHGDRLVVAGRLKRVPWGRHCATVTAEAIDEHGTTRIVKLSGIRPTLLGRNLAGEARDDYDIENHTLEFGSVSHSTSEYTGLSPYHVGALMRGFQIAGALERVLQMSVQYSTERVQFGRPIAKFQAIQHQVAELAGHVAAASVAVDAALVAAQSRNAVFEVAAAKLCASESATASYAIAHQVHGAMGFTHEHPLHLSTRRLLSWRDEFGSEAEWAGVVSRQIEDIDADNLWQFISAPAPGAAHRMER